MNHEEFERLKQLVQEQAKVDDNANPKSQPRAPPGSVERKDAEKNPERGRIYSHNPLPGRRGTAGADGGIHARDLLSGADQSHMIGRIGLFLAARSLPACLSLKDSYKG
jgi:hypothetical protein